MKLPIGMMDPRGLPLGIKPQIPGQRLPVPPGPLSYNEQALRLAGPMMPPQPRQVPGLLGGMPNVPGGGGGAGMGGGEQMVGTPSSGRLGMGNYNWLNAFNRGGFGSLPPQFAGGMGVQPWDRFK